MTAQAALVMGWRNRIVGHADVPPSDLVPNPHDWRTHPLEQQRALTGALTEVGWVSEVLVSDGSAGLTGRTGLPVRADGRW